MQVNYFGTTRCTRTALPYMRDSADGIAPHRPHIVNVSSTAGLIALPFAGDECAPARGSCKTEVFSACQPCCRTQLRPCDIES